MASIIIGSALLAGNKIREHSKAKKAKKQQEYEDRYAVLQGEHEEKYAKGAEAGAVSKNGNPFGSGGEKVPSRRASEESERGYGGAGEKDGPAEWVAQHQAEKTRFN